MDSLFTKDSFDECLNEILIISDRIHDGWILKQKGDNRYLTKHEKCRLLDSELNEEINATIEYHLVYNISFGVPALSFNVWRPDGRLLQLEEYWKYNSHLKDCNMFSTLTQLEHPALQKPILTLHPCKTEEIMRPFFGNSKNPVISWLTVVADFVHLQISQDYVKAC